MNTVKQLRAKFGESQQAFAVRLGVAVVTVARWETSRPPSGKWLIRLVNLANQYGHHGCASALMIQSGYGITQYEQHKGKALLPQNEMELAYVSALLTIMRSRDKYEREFCVLDPILERVAYWLSLSSAA